MCPRILVVDDNADVRESLRLILEGEGFTVDVAANGEEALARQKDEPADVMVTDIFMPRYDGLETLAAFQARYPGTRVVVVSGEQRVSRANYLGVAEILGADAVFRKPVAPEALVAAIRGLLPATT